MRGDDEVGDGVEGDGHGHGHVLQQAAVRVQQRRGHVLRRPVTQSHQHLQWGQSMIHDQNLLAVWFAKILKNAFWILGLIFAD